MIAKWCMHIGEKSSPKKSQNIESALYIAEDLLRDGMRIKDVSSITELPSTVLKKLVKEKKISVQTNNFIQKKGTY